MSPEHMASAVIPILAAFEEHTGLGPVASSRLLCIAYVTYAHYRSGSRPVPRIVEGVIEVLMEIPRVHLDRFIKART